MPRRQQTPRKLYGEEHHHGGGKRPWRTVLNWPTEKYSGFRVGFKEDREQNGNWKWTTRNATTEAEGRRIFAQAEEALRTSQPVPARAQVHAIRTVGALCELYLADSRRRSKTARTVEARQSLMNAHVAPVLAQLPVSKWRLTHSQELLDRSVELVGAARLRDIRSTLSALVRLAWREGWLDRSVDPLDGVETKKAQVEYGAGSTYVPTELRPTRLQVETMARAADFLAVCGDGIEEPVRRLPLLGTKVRVAAYGGLRLGEQNALRAVDVLFDEGSLFVNGSWTCL